MSADALASITATIKQDPKAKAELVQLRNEYVTNMTNQNEALKNLAANLATRRTSLTESEKALAASILEKSQGLELAIKDLKQ